MVSPLAPAGLAMPGHPVRRGLGVIALLAGLLLPVAPAFGQSSDPIIDVVEVGGVVDRTMAGYVVDVLDKAQADGAEAVVVELDSPGALGDSAQRVVDAIVASEVPVAVWVGPPGAWAVGGALAIAQAGDVLAASPGTLLGAGAPLDLAGDEGGVAAADLIGSLARSRGRDVEAARSMAEGVVAVAPVGADAAVLPDDAVLPDGVAPGDVRVHSAPALADSRVIDLPAQSLPDLLASLDGLEVAGAPLDVDTTSASVRFNNLGLVRQVLHALTSPALVYLLVVGGALALLFEVFQPGFGVAGTAGVAVLALGVYGLVLLPASLVGVALVTAGYLLLAADLALGRLGLLTAAGTLAFAAGSVVLFTGPPLLDIPYWLVALATVTNAVFFVGVMTTVLRAQGNQALAGADRLVGETGVVRSMLNPEGHVFVRGALWRARAPESAGRVRTGTAVRVLGLNDRLTLDVEPVETDAQERQSSRIG